MSNWSYSINYGPEGEANYANVFDGEERLVGNLRIHHAVAVVNAMNAAPDLLSALEDAVSLLEMAGCSTVEHRAAIAKATGGSHD